MKSKEGMIFLLVIASGIALSLIYQLLILLYIFFPWAFPWVGNFIHATPPKPQITYAEFKFKLTYELDGEIKIIEDTIICEFDGFNIDEGRGKTRRWKYCYENEQNNEIFVYEKSPNFPKIVLENIDQYKIILGVSSAQYFLSEPEYTGTPELPSIQVYDTSIGYYKDPTQSKEFLNEHNFKVIDWYCDPPIENSFK